eukprot:TRINITY_DN1932_c0_g2_i1.p1 TRINITY_DN1932_c0_g2~~TRINITY_DN1932_c0_g2_i1.p1  ORF type:complete len:511 (+),score=169.23 TRINITY_DN1932_c0_g2_i1:1071-2603(+)
MAPGALRALRAALGVACASAAVVPLDRLPWEEGGRGEGQCTWVVKYFHPECGGCRAVAGPFRNVARRAREQGLKCLVGAVDCDAHFDYCEKQGATEFPLVHVWQGGRAAAGPEVLVFDDLAAKEELEEALWQGLLAHCTAAEGAGCTQEAAFPDEWEQLENDPEGGPYIYDTTLDRDRVWPEDVLRALQVVLMAPAIDPEKADDDRGPTAFLALAREAYPAPEIRAALGVAIARGDSVRAIAQALPVNASVPWKGCSGSARKYRGRTCAIWQLFHTLTLQCAVRHCRQAPLAVIRQWVMERFSCKTCRRHFTAGAKDWDIDAMPPQRQALVLWAFHNEVNARLAGDATDDPEHKKEQFPSRAACPACWDDLVLPNREALLKFLLLYYGVAGSVRREGAPRLPGASPRAALFVLQIVCGVAALLACRAAHRRRNYFWGAPSPAARSRAISDVESPRWIPRVESQDSKEYESPNLRPSPHCSPRRKTVPDGSRFLLSSSQRASSGSFGMRDV